MSKYFNILTECLVDSKDGVVPQNEEVSILIVLTDLEYAIMQLRMYNTREDVYSALELADDLYTEVGN